MKNIRHPEYVAGAIVICVIVLGLAMPVRGALLVSFASVAALIAMGVMEYSPRRRCYRLATQAALPKPAVAASSASTTGTIVARNASKPVRVSPAIGVLKKHHA